jgi:pimeloyl-ACP methyl ester carboxylesterase
MTGLRLWASSQARALVVVVAVARIPRLARVLSWVTAEPVVEEEQLAGVPVSVYRAGRDRQRPAIVFLNGVTARGRRHPDVRRLAQALARVGFLVAVPDPPGLASGQIDGDTVGSVVAVVGAVTDRRDVKGGRVGLVGVSFGATLALVVAEDAHLAPRVTIVAGVAPYTDFANAVRLATIGHALEAGALVPFQPVGFLGLVVARSLVGALPPSRTRDELLAELERVPDDAPDPLARFRSAAGREPEDADVHALVALLGNRDPARFDGLYEALPVELRTGIAQLSPLGGAAALRAPVEILVGPNDPYLPTAEAQALAAAATGTHVRVTVTSALRHADARLGWRKVAEFVRFDGSVVRTIAAARRP